MNIVLAGAVMHPQWLGGESRVANNIIDGLAGLGVKVYKLYHLRKPMAIPFLSSLNLPEINTLDLHPTLYDRYLRVLKRLKPDAVVGWFDYDTTFLQAALKRCVPSIVAVQIYWPVCPLLTLFIEGKGVCPGPSAWRCYQHMVSLGKWNMISKVPSARSLLGSLIVQKLRQRMKVLNRMNAIIVPSKWVKKKLIECGIEEHLINVIYNGLSVESFHGRKYIGGKKIILLPGARATEHKGYNHFFRLAETIAERYSDVEFVATGLEIGSRHVKALPYISSYNLMKLMSDAYMVVVPSLWEEPFGLAVIEAMAMEKPVVAYASGGIPEIVQDGVTGFLAQTGNLSQLVALVERLLLHSELTLKMGEAGRKLAKEKFDLGFTTRGYYELLKKVTGP